MEDFKQEQLRQQKIKQNEKRIKRKMFFGLLLISSIVTVIYLGFTGYQKQKADSENMALTVDEIEEYSEEDYNKDTFNVDFDKLSKKDKEKYDNINSSKLNLYELSQERVRSDIKNLLNVDTEEDNKKVLLKIKCDKYFYDNYMTAYEDYKIPNLEDFDIQYAGVSFDNDIVCKYIVIGNAVNNNGNNYYTLKINIDYRNGVLTTFTVSKKGD